MSNYIGQILIIVERRKSTVGRCVKANLCHIDLETGLTIRTSKGKTRGYGYDMFNTCIAKALSVENEMGFCIRDWCKENNMTLHMCFNEKESVTAISILKKGE